MRDDEPRRCIHCGILIVRNEDGVWGNASWIERGYHSIGLTCPYWEPGRLLESMDTKHEGSHFPGILIADVEEAEVEDWDDLETNDYRGGV